eukprot:EG_transcript_23019
MAFPFNLSPFFLPATPAPPLPAEAPQSPTVPKAEKEKLNTCLDFLKGKCSRGDQCRFVHPDLADFRSLFNEAEVCIIHVMTGLCKFGPRCNKLHPKRDAALIAAVNAVPPAHAGVADRLSASDSSSDHSRRGSDQHPHSPARTDLESEFATITPTRRSSGALCVVGDPQVDDMVKGGLLAILDDPASSFDRLFMAVLRDLNLISF